MYQLAEFSIDDLLACAENLHEAEGHSMEAVATALVNRLYSCLRRDDEPAAALVRFYTTVPFEQLPDDLQTFARDIQPGVTGKTRCLTLLASRGLEPSWNDRRRSGSHQAIPLHSVAMVEQSPMINGLLAALGFEVVDVVDPEPLVALQRHHNDFGVFHVAQARGSAAIPAQEEFVEPYGIESVIGFGGLLPSGNIFAVIVFATVPVSERVADLFRSLSLTVKALVVPHTYNVFSEFAD